ncbi:MAG: hypothetical protein C0434_07000 [Xanthomonadaceae bacterium]|nr:hypothetical protein [Xanthomonadaceae bacterium]
MSHESQTQAAQPSTRLALIDWLSVSVVPPDGSGLDWIADALLSVFGIGRDCWQVTGRGWFGYRQRINLGELGLLAHGGERQRGTVHFELNAHACARITDWQAVRGWGEAKGARISRVDLAHDDFDGTAVNIQQMLTWNRDGGFASGGRLPKARLVDDLESGEGKTFYVGKRQHGKLLRGYEKGKQLGKPDDRWFRVEVELHNKGRVIPWEILTEPGRYLAGAYPCLGFLHAEQCRIATQRRALELSYGRMERWVSDAAGKALNAMMTAHHGDALSVMARLVKEGFPKRLIGFSADDLNQLGEVP